MPAVSLVTCNILRMLGRFCYDTLSVNAYILVYVWYLYISRFDRVYLRNLSLYFLNDFTDTITLNLVVYNKLL